MHNLTYYNHIDVYTHTHTFFNNDPYIMLLASVLYFPLLCCAVCAMFSYAPSYAILGFIILGFTLRYYQYTML